MKLTPSILALTLLLPAQGFLPRVDPSPWDTILKEYVNQQHRVDYAALKKNASTELSDFVASLGKPGSQPLSPTEEKALLINAYNAMTVDWIIENYPTRSIWQTKQPFETRRFRLGGEAVSLNEIESRLRKMGDPRIHAALVCAALSCPPLRREAYVADRLDEQLDSNVQEWLANSSLNRFDPDRHEATVSPIFKWYQQDFDSFPGGLQGFLLKYAPPEVAQELGSGKLQISFMSYRWGLNDQSNLGRRYSKIALGFDWLKNWFRSWFARLGARYNVNPVVFGSIYVGAIPFFTICVGWIISNLRRKRSIVVPVLAASFFFISAYLYLLIVGRNIPAWVYGFIAAMLAFGILSTIKKIRSKAGESAPR